MKKFFLLSLFGSGLFMTNFSVKADWNKWALSVSESSGISVFQIDSTTGIGTLQATYCEPDMVNDLDGSAGDFKEGCVDEIGGNSYINQSNGNPIFDLNPEQGTWRWEKYGKVNPHIGKDYFIEYNPQTKTFTKKNL